MSNNLKVAIVYDWIDKWGGVERILLTLQEMFPKVVFYTSYYDHKRAAWAKNLKITSSFIQRLPSFIKKNRFLSFPFYPYAFESFNLSRFDLVISVTSSFAKAVITKPQTTHLCYLLTPTRYLWVYENLYANNFVMNLINPYLKKIKQWDLFVSQRPDKIISISKTAADRCWRYYQRKSEVIYPPFDIKYWQTIKTQIANCQYQINFESTLVNSKYFLVVSRLEPYKRVDLVVQSFNRLKTNLVIVGEGSQERKLKATAGRNIIFLKKLTDRQLGCLYQQAQALIIPQEEDFGYTALESQFFGCPVIAYKKGGATETIIAGKTGIFFEQQTKESLIKCLERFELISYNLKHRTNLIAKKHLEQFSKERFIIKFRQTISN